MDGRHVGTPASTSAAAILSGLVAGVCILLPGCSQAKTSKKFTEWLNRKNAHYQVLVALESDSADERREAVNRLARTKELTAEWAFAALDTIARTDRNEHVRAAALRAMKGYFDERPAETTLMILNQPKHKAKVRPASPGVRWEAIELLDVLRRRSLISSQRQEEALESLLAALRDEKNRNVRLAAADALGEYADGRALRALVEAMDTRDFGLAYACEQSLVRLTGTTQGYRADRWTAWLQEAGEPFAGAGQIPAERRAGKTSWWDRTVQFVRGAVVAWQGEAKEGG